MREALVEINIPVTDAGAALSLHGDTSANDIDCADCVPCGDKAT